MPTLRHGKICHIELPAADPRASAAIGGDLGEVTARFCDPGGNVVGLYQEP